MPIQIDDLLKPISADEPAGSDLRYAPVTDQIKEARRSDDDVSQGVWKRDVKEADYRQVIKLATQALTKQGKDLQVAAWLTEALVAQERVAGLRQGLELMYRLLTEYWDTVYPQIEDGELDMRAVPLNWVATQLDPVIKRIPIAEQGIDAIRYADTRTIPTEEESQFNQDKMRARADAIADGRLTPEEFEKAFEATPLAFYEKLKAQLEDVLQYLETLSSFCDSKFGETVNFVPLRSTLEALGQPVHVFFIKKGGKISSRDAEPEPEPQPEVPSAAPSMAAPTFVPDAGVAYATAPAPAPRPAAPKALSAEPQDANDAIERIIQAAHYLRRQNLFNPVPYLVLRALRWGEVRGQGFADLSLAVAPDSATRVELKRLFNEFNWEQLLNVAETAMAQPAGRAWLDLQRFVVRACRNYGAQGVASAIVSELRALLADFPDVANWTLPDDTPVANAETQQWFKEEQILKLAAPPPPPPQPELPPMPVERPAAAGNGAPKEPDVYELALAAIRRGSADEGIKLLIADLPGQRTGRDRFRRRAQLAQICLATGHEAIALPILRQLCAEIDAHRLEDWESIDLIVQPLALLYRCLKSDPPDPMKEELYARICRLDPGRAIELLR
jgi:type VI secretion system protein ImpA